MRKFFAQLFAIALLLATPAASDILINPYIFNQCAAGISFVGSATTGSANGNVILDLNLPSGMQENDVVIVQHSYGDEGSGSTTTSSGWTQEAFVDAGQPNYKIYSKRMGSSPDATISFPAWSAASESQTAIASAWRCVDQTTLLDTAITTALSIDPPSATPATTGAIAIAALGVRVNDTSGTSSPAGYSTIVQIGHTSSRSTTTYFSYKTGLTGGVAENPGTYSGVTSTSPASFTIILRPQL